jgi:hypothetical protein
MFNRLNIRTESRKFSPWMCKFLATQSGFRHSLFALFRASSYLLESMRLRNAILESIGLRIATPLRRPVFAHIRNGKG